MEPGSENIVQPVVPPLNLKPTKKVVIIGAVIILAGLLSGFAIYKIRSRGTVIVGGKQIETVKSTTEEGVKDATQFPDQATGIIQVNDGKIINEGSHILVRDGAGQNAYLTSSVVDLDKYVGKKVTVWGKTYKGQKAGWLMDIGRVKVNE